MKKVVLGLIVLVLLAINVHAVIFDKKTINGWKINYDLSIDEPQSVEFLIKHSVQPKYSNSSYEIFVYEKLSDKKGQQILRHRTNVNDFEPIKFNVALRKGNYDIKLISNNYFDIPFEFKINQRITGNFEQEPNNSFSEANQIEEKYFYTGYMSRRDGVEPSDYYKLTMPEDGEMKIVFQTDDICDTKENDKDCYVVTLYSGNLSEANNERINNPLFNFKPKQKEEEGVIGLPKGEYYLRIHSQRILGSVDKNRPYRIAYITTATEHTELEPNDKSKNATLLTAGKYYSAEIQEKYAEVDYFSFEVPQKQTITVAFKFKNDKRFGRGISLYDENNKRITEFSLNKQDSQKQFEVILEKGKYFLMVHYEEGTQYSIKVILPKVDLLTQKTIKSSEKLDAEKSFLEKIEEQKKIFVK